MVKQHWHSWATNFVPVDSSAASSTASVSRRIANQNQKLSQFVLLCSTLTKCTLLVDSACPPNTSSGFNWLTQPMATFLTTSYHQLLCQQLSSLSMVITIIAFSFFSFHQFQLQLLTQLCIYATHGCIYSYIHIVAHQQKTAAQKCACSVITGSSVC